MCKVLLYILKSHEISENYKDKLGKFIYGAILRGEVLFETIELYGEERLFVVPGWMETKKQRKQGKYEIRKYPKDLRIFRNFQIIELEVCVRHGS